MRTAILIVICTASEIFLVYAFVHFIAESKRTSRHTQTLAAPPTYAQTGNAESDLVVPLSTATWSDGVWETSTGSFLPKPPLLGNRR